VRGVVFTPLRRGVPRGPAARPQRTDTGRRRGLAVGLGAGAVLVLAALAGWLLPTLLASDPAPPRGARTVTLGTVSVRVSADWSPARGGATELRGLDRARTRVFSPYPGLAAQAVLTVAPATDPTLIPAAVRKALPEPPGKPAEARVGGRTAWVYHSVATGRPDRVMDFYVLPTSAGVLGVACVASELSWSAVAGCGQSIESVTVAGGRVLAPSPELAFLAQLPRPMAKLDRSRVLGRRALQRARTRRGQAGAATALARAYATAMAALAPLGHGPASSGVVHALRAGGQGYHRLAGAAAHGRPRRYAAARAQVHKAEKRLRHLLERLAGGPPS
jgi:hypothetical protein